jgi:hypothetical protein
MLTALADARAFADPRVRGVDPGGQLVVGDDPLREEATDAGCDTTHDFGQLGGSVRGGGTGDRQHTGKPPHIPFDLEANPLWAISKVDRNRLGEFAVAGRAVHFSTGR